MVTTWQLRAQFARRLSALYGAEVPAYATLLEVSNEVNGDVIERRGSDAERLGSTARVTAERHGAIRVGTARELAQVARIFAALGMHPTGFYDLRDAAPTPIPVVSTAFRPIDPVELARNPFRVFTSMLVPNDRRFFREDLASRLNSFLNIRRLFGDELLQLADRAEADGGLMPARAERFLELATAAFAMSKEPVDRPWYAELERVSSVAADIGGVRTTHINHLTPRVLDIDELYRRMMARGIEMIDRIQGPPRWQGPDILLRQTSFRALAEPRRFLEADGSVGDGELRVRFGEVEYRGIAPTPAGRARYEAMMALADERCADHPDSVREEVMVQVWREHLPATEQGLVKEDLAYFTFRVNDVRPSGRPPQDLAGLLAQDWVSADPIVYEDFLPRSAAGIFSSNLSGDARVDTSQGGAQRDIDWLSGVLDRPVHEPFSIYDAQRRTSIEQVARALGLPGISPLPQGEHR
ncbi:2-oxoadipate dioxygenase/decarboxylase [Nonomuraea sp. KM88]|uniref:2-oxoadipate dioxygenase/decarboxylase n=1 Tax=Nonomuraea sp. KM88 TaxID=3457427 RepID=UPI003FCEC929